MDVRRLMLNAVLLAMLAGPHRCCCGIRTAAADSVPRATACCSCCDLPDQAAGCRSTDDCGEAGCRCSPVDEDRPSDDRGCPARGTPKQAWDIGTAGPEAKFKATPAYLPAGSPAAMSFVLHAAAESGPSRAIDERAVVWGRGLLLRLQILRC